MGQTTCDPETTKTPEWQASTENRLIEQGNERPDPRRKQEGMGKMAMVFERKERIRLGSDQDIQVGGPTGKGT
jgi:hypothetical protein